MKANPPAHTGKRILSENGKKSLIVHLLLEKIKKLRNMNASGTCLLTGSSHECSLRFLETPLPCFDTLSAAIRNRDDKFW
jgi:hypothetical protein